MFLISPLPSIKYYIKRKFHRTSLVVLQGIFSTQGLNTGLLHCRWILYFLNYQGSPRILEWVDYPFSNGSSQSRNLTQGLLLCRWILYQLSYQESPIFSVLATKKKG